MYVHICLPYQIELPCIYLSPRWRFWRGYLPFGVYPSSLTRFQAQESCAIEAPGSSSWIVPNSSKERPHVAHCAREQQFIVYLKLCSRVAAVCLRDGYFARRFHSFLSFSFSSLLLVYIKYNIVARFRRYRLANSRQSTIKPRRI